MNSEERTFRSTSRNSAITEDIIIRETGTTRLVFRPILVTNEKSPESSVKGGFIFQRKGISEKWEDIAVPPLSSLKKGEAIKLELKSQELKKLHSEISNLYEIYDAGGIPFGETKFIKANATVQALAGMTDEELTAVIGGQKSIGTEALSRLIAWASHTDNFTLIFRQLQQLGQDSLADLNSALGVASLKHAIKQWKKNRRNDEEEFWQKLLSEQAFVLEQVFHIPIVVIKSKAYVGGKSVMNVDGKVVDFLVKNKVTSSIALIEIKTPMTPLLGSQYRSGAHNVSTDLSGAVMQILTYCDSLSKERTNLLAAHDIQASVFDPQCIIVIGNAGRELSDEDKRRSFELYRRQLKGVNIITYDEMYERTKRLVQVLEHGLDS